MATRFINGIGKLPVSVGVSAPGFGQCAHLPWRFATGVPPGS
ncbi:hypothetical protein [Bradyrhizobium sp. 145]|nr:hypothetical protein [Bradyrhizobium sp. 145]